jgi:hypothetical protein
MGWFVKGNLGKIRPKKSSECHVVDGLVDFPSSRTVLTNGWFELQIFETLSRYIANF